MYSRRVSLPSLHRTMTPQTFTVIGDNIHTAREVRLRGPSVKKLKDGREAVVFPAAPGKLTGLPIPDRVRSTDAYRAGRVPNVTVGVEVGMNGTDVERRAAGRYLQWLAARQVEHGAQFIDVCIDHYGESAEERIAAMRWLVPVIQQACDCPLAVDAEDPRVLLAGLEVYDIMKGGRPMLHAASIDKPPLFQVAAKFRAHTVVRTTGRGKLRRIKTAEERLANAKDAMRMAADAGIPKTDIYLDPGVVAAAREAKGCRAVLDAIRKMRHRWPDVHVAGTHAHVSNSLPMRRVLNLVWLGLAVEAGCDAGLLDPATCHPNLLQDVDLDHPAFRMARAGFSGQDPYFGEFVAACRAKELQNPFTQT